MMYDYAAQDSNGTIWLFKEKPVASGGAWYPGAGRTPAARVDHARGANSWDWSDSLIDLTQNSFWVDRNGSLKPILRKSKLYGLISRIEALGELDAARVMHVRAHRMRDTDKLAEAIDWSKTPYGGLFWGSIWAKLSTKRHPYADVLEAVAADKSLEIERQLDSGRWVRTRVLPLDTPVRIAKQKTYARMFLGEGGAPAVYTSADKTDVGYNWIGEWQEVEL